MRRHIFLVRRQIAGLERGQVMSYSILLRTGLVAGLVRGQIVLAGGQVPVRGWAVAGQMAGFHPLFGRTMIRQEDRLGMFACMRGNVVRKGIRGGMLVRRQLWCFC